MERISFILSASSILNFITHTVQMERGFKRYF